jgi:CheY-like chemotaxis protein
MVAVEALEYGGLDVIQAATGEEALQHCRDAIADILFTDIRLPGTVTGGASPSTAEKGSPTFR